MKKIITLCLSLCMTAALAAPAHALEYSIAAPDDYDFGSGLRVSPWIWIEYHRVRKCARL